MKKLLILTLSYFCILNTFSQSKYSIQEILNGYDIIIILSENEEQNNSLVISILQDTIFQKCTTMHISGRFSKLPNNFKELALKNIKILEIQSDKPIIINSIFNGFTNLEYLMCFTAIKNIENSVFLPKIESIDFQNAKLKNFPKVIFTWISLQSIDIQNCHFSNIPNEIEKLQNLEFLNLSNNNIIELPDSFYSLKKIKSIGLYGNKLKELSTKLCTFEFLEFICLDDNKNLKLQKEVYECLDGKLFLNSN